MTAAARILGIDAPLITPILGSVQSQSRLERIIRRFKVQTIYHAAAYRTSPRWLSKMSSRGFRTMCLAHSHLCVLRWLAGLRPSSWFPRTRQCAQPISWGRPEHPGSFDLSGPGATAWRAPDGALWQRAWLVRLGDPTVQETVAARWPVDRVTHADITRYFMTIPEAAQLVLQADCQGR